MNELFKEWQNMNYDLSNEYWLDICVDKVVNDDTFESDWRIQMDYER